MAFGDNPFGDNKPRIGQRGRGGRGGGGGGGGGGGNNRNRNRNRNRGGGGGETSETTTGQPNAFTAGDVGSGDPFDTAYDRPGTDSTFGGAGSIFDDPDSAGGESWRTNAWGLLNQAGITQDAAFGGQQADWLDSQLQDWYDQWQGQGAQAGDDANTWLDFMYGVPGVAPGAGDLVTTTSTTPGEAAADIPEWQQWVRDETGKGFRHLNKGRRERLREQYQALATGGTPGTTTTNTSPTLGWIRDTWGPAMQQYLTARYQSQTPRQRGTQVSAWTGPRRVIQFLVTLASVGTIVAEFVSKAVGG